MFLRTRLHPTNELDGQLYMSCLFFGLVHMMFNGFSELPIMISRLPVFYKQRDNAFHPAWAWALASWILRVPYSVLEAVVWSCVVYYNVGFAPGLKRYASISRMFYTFCSIFLPIISPFTCQILPFHVLALFHTSNGIGPLQDDGFCGTRYGHRQYIWISFYLSHILVGWIYYSKE